MDAEKSAKPAREELERTITSHAAAKTAKTRLIAAEASVIVQVSLSCVCTYLCAIVLDIVLNAIMVVSTMTARGGGNDREPGGQAEAPTAGGGRCTDY